MRSQVTLVLLAFIFGLVQSAANEFIGTWVLKSKPPIACGLKGDKINISRKSNQLLLEATLANDIGCSLFGGKSFELFSEIPSGKTALFKVPLAEQMTISVLFTVEGDKAYVGQDGMFVEFERSKGGSFLIIVILLVIVSGAAFFMMKNKDNAELEKNLPQCTISYDHA